MENQHAKRSEIKKTRRMIFSRWQLYLFMLPAVVYMAIFSYKPMYGIIIAFKDFSARKGILGSEWVGFDNFERLFRSYWFPILLKNTLTLSGLSLLIEFPMPIILALLLNELRNAKFRKTVQTISYAPHFISTVVMCGMITMLLDPRTGVINNVIGILGGDAVYFMQNADWFKWIFVFSGVWQGVGWGSIIFYAALAGVDPALLEAAEMDGANRLQKIWHINIPEILPTVVVMFILKCGNSGVCHFLD